jgi:hypothetical protein
MAPDGLLQAVRRQLRIGRLLPLGAREDGAWMAERAATRMLHRAVAEAVADGWLDGLRLGLADEDAGADGAAVPPPPSALPPGPLVIEAECAAGLERPLPECVAQVRDVLATTARERIGLDVTGVDVHVARLLDAPEAEGGRGVLADEPLSRVPVPVAAGNAVAEAVLAVPGVLGLSGALGGPTQALSIRDEEGGAERGADAAPAGRRLVRVQLAVAADRRTVDVVRAARAAVAEATRAGAPGQVTVTVLVTEVADAAERPS